MISNLVFGCGLLLAAAILAVVNLRNAIPAEERGDQEGQFQNAAGHRDCEYRRRQYRRRNLAAGLIAIIAVFMLLAIFVTSLVQEAVLWAVVGLLVIWLLLLAVLDLAATRDYFAALHRQQLQERDRFREDLREIQAARDEGASKEI